MGEKILEQENVGIWKQLCHERSFALLQMWGCEVVIPLSCYSPHTWFDMIQQILKNRLHFMLIPSSLRLSNGWNVLANKSPHLDKVNFTEGNVCIVIHVCPPTVFKPVTDHFNEYLLNVKGSQHPHHVLVVNWSHILVDNQRWWKSGLDWFYEQC